MINHLIRLVDDGWYYKSLVKQNVGGFKYKIEDMNKVTIEISREDVISESDASNFLEVFYLKNLLPQNNLQ